MVGPPHPQSATFRHTDFTEPFRHNSNLYGAISSRLQRGWGETPVTSEQCQAICNQIKRRIEAIKKLRDEEQIFDVQAIHDLRAYCRYQCGGMPFAAALIKVLGNF